MTEIILKSFYERGKDEKVTKMNVNFLGENFVWFEFVLENGKKVQTMCLKGEV